MARGKRRNPRPWGTLVDGGSKESDYQRIEEGVSSMSRGSVHRRRGQTTARVSFCGLSTQPFGWVSI
ncbi:hypothetical protein E2562_001844 [Oryza meyeriana var. granulata]|uniref:Uncharacterized protein n=1 Tax=Oryza meyeriana var. granulata TaxID=110450 RepID=A0A6G1C3E1_9ORYZ|nr:hypothetical protein E2562_001844 [Oryza meyeriana var. granulata]